MRFIGKIFDNLERMGNAEFHGVLRRIGKKSVVPTAAIAKPSPISRKGKPWHNPAVYFLRRNDLGVDGLHNPHRTAAQMLRIEPLQGGKLVGLAVPTWGNDLAAIPQQSRSARRASFAQMMADNSARSAADNAFRRARISHRISSLPDGITAQ